MSKPSHSEKPPVLFDPVTHKLSVISQVAQRPVFNTQHASQMIEPTADIPLALVVSDVHLSFTPPTLHVDNPDWFDHIGRNFEWLFEQATKYNVPILIAGDIFDKAISDSRLLSFVISLFSKTPQPIYAVAGNHDLPFHSIDRIEESGYAVLMKAGVLIDCSESQSYVRNNTLVQVHGYHWLKPFNSIIQQDMGAIQIALVHRMLTDGKAGWYPGCNEHTIDVVMKQFNHYFHYAVFGDNHVPFESFYNAIQGKIHVLNPGGFIRRTRSDLDLVPRAYLLQLRGAAKVEVPTDIARAGETRGTVDARECVAVGEPEISVVSAFASLPSFLSESSDGTYVVPDITTLYRQYVSTLSVPEVVHKKLAEITGLSPH
jgi:UDP-2,3-diacylglucosamine pyrophosphatase LpxH